VLVRSGLRKSDVLATRGSSFGAGFTNQPANDGIEVVSSSALDVQYLDLYGTTHGTTTLVRERIHLTGTSVVSTVKTNWGRLLGALIPRGLGRNAVGTITIREASGNATITTIVPTARSSGIVLVSSANRPMFGLPGVVVGSEPSTRIVGLIGTALDNSTAVLEAVALAGTDLVSLTESLASITALLIGDIDDTTVVDIKLHPHYDISTIVGVALADAEPATKVPVNLIHRERNRELEGAEAARTYSVTVTGGVIADSYTTPVSILPPPPSGKSYLVERVKASWEYGSAPMVSGSFTDIGFAFTSSGTLVSSLVPLAVLEGTSDYTKVHTLGTSVLVNEGLELVAAGDDATDGGTDNSLTLTIVYRIVSIM
jgi:hypothetical protein